MAGAGEYDSHASFSGTIRLAGGPRAPLVLTPIINFRYIYSLIFYQYSRNQKLDLVLPYTSRVHNLYH